MGKLRNRSIDDWHLSNLHPLYDPLTLSSGHIRHDSHNPGVKIRSIEDARKAWEANRDELMLVCTHPQPCTKCRRAHPWANQPGSRPWAYWHFELNYDGIPEDQRAELESLGLLAAAELLALAPKPDNADVLKFPSEDDDD